PRQRSCAAQQNFSYSTISCRADFLSPTMIRFAGPEFTVGSFRAVGQNHGAHRRTITTSVSASWATAKRPTLWQSISASEVGYAPRHDQNQNNPTILPSVPTSMASAAGTLGRPGIVMISPQIATMNSAPAESRTSRTVTTWSVGAPLRSPLVVKLYWVLAMH